MNRIVGLSNKIRNEADEIKTMTTEEVKKLPNMLGILASLGFEHKGWYGYNQVDNNGRKILLIKA